MGGFSLEEVAESERRWMLKNKETATVVSALDNGVDSGSYSEDEVVASDPCDSAYDYQRLKDFAPANRINRASGHSNNASESEILLQFLTMMVFICWLKK